MICFRSIGSTLVNGSKHLRCNNIMSMGSFQVAICKICFNTFSWFLTRSLQLGTIHHSTLLNRCFSFVTFITFECENNSAIDKLFASSSWKNFTNMDSGLVWGIQMFIPSSWDSNQVSNSTNIESLCQNEELQYSVKSEGLKEHDPTFMHDV